ncbi:MAG: hypothetical protein ACFFAO_14805 [Candidatus Hermodarchaeota archaeon]
MSKEEEKIEFGQKNISCFACGQEINEETEICPYCGTKQGKVSEIPKD